MKTLLSVLFLVAALPTGLVKTPNGWVYRYNTGQVCGVVHKVTVSSNPNLHFQVQTASGYKNDWTTEEEAKQDLTSHCLGGPR